MSSSASLLKSTNADPVVDNTPTGVDSGLESSDSMVVKIPIKKSRKRAAANSVALDAAAIVSAPLVSTVSDDSASVANSDASGADCVVVVSKPKRQRRRAVAGPSDDLLSESADESTQISEPVVVKPRRPVGDHALSILKLWRDACIEVGGNPVLRKSNALYQQAKTVFCDRFIKSSVAPVAIAAVSDSTPEIATVTVSN